jgi:Flp pilus assembly protein TadB
MRLYYAEEFGTAFTPKKVRPVLRKYLLKAGITEEPYAFFGLMFYASLGATFIFYMTVIWQAFMQMKPLMDRTTFLVYFGLGTMLAWVLIPLTIIGVIIICIYFYLDLRIYSRTKKMEEILPDFLELVSSNLKGGLSFERSLWTSIKPRFGILSNEIAIAAKKVMTGGDVEDALTEFADKYDSPTLRRTITLIVGEIQSGGKISDIIDNVVDNLKKTQILKEEMTASVITYMIFIAAVVIFISPVLFALSLNLLQIIQQVTGQVAQGTSQMQGQMPFSVEEVNLDREDFVLFSHLALLIIGFFSSMIVSIIEKGNVKGGIKYVPIFIISSQLFYLLCLKLLTSLFGGMLGFE